MPNTGSGWRSWCNFR